MCGSQALCSLCYLYEFSSGLIIPDFVQGHQIVIHFASSAPGVKNEYLNKPQLNTYHHENLLPKEDWDTLLLQLKNIELPNLNILCCELDSLEKQCGSNILGEIFFEIKDGRNAVTNLSVKFPKVREAMEKLYDEYGFNAIYDELEL